MNKLSNYELLGNRGERLRKYIQKTLIQKNQYGLNRQESMLLQKMIKEFHQNAHEMNSAKS